MIQTVFLQRVRPLLAGVAVAVGACGGGDAPRVPESLPSPQVGPARLARLETVEGLVDAAKRAGAGRAAVVAQGIVLEGERAGAFVDVPEGECLLVLARGALSILDIDLVVWSDEGEWLAGDERRDAEPAVFLCPPHPRRVHVLGTVAAGQGAIAITAQRVAPDHVASVRAWLVGLRPASQRPSERAHRVLVHADPDAQTLVPVELEGGHCLDARAAGSGGTVDPDMTLVDERLVVRKKAASEGLDGVRLRFCVSEGFRGSLGLRSRLGQGDILVTLTQGRRVTWEREGRPIEDLNGGTPASIGAHAQAVSILGNDAQCIYMTAPRDGACELWRAGADEPAPLPAALCLRDGEVRCTGEGGGVPTQHRVALQDIAPPSSRPRGFTELLERGIEALGEGVVNVRTVSSKGSEPLVIAWDRPQEATAARGLVVLVRERRARFVARVFAASGVIVHQSAGIGSVVFAAPPTGHAIELRASHVDDDETLVAVVPVP